MTPSRQTQTLSLGAGVLVVIRDLTLLLGVGTGASLLSGTDIPGSVKWVFRVCVVGFIGSSIVLLHLRKHSPGRIAVSIINILSGMTTMIIGLPMIAGHETGFPPHVMSSGSAWRCPLPSLSAHRSRGSICTDGVERH